MDGTEPISLPDLRRLVLSRIDPAMLDRHNTWVHQPALQIYQAWMKCLCCPRDSWGNIAPSKRFGKQLLGHAQEFMAPLSENPDCRVIKRGNRWTNRDYCPPTPFGEYRWWFTVQMVQELIWYEAEFTAGFYWWYSPLRESEGKEARDANPFRPGERHDSWDKGYILGHAFHYQPDKVIRWLDAMRTAT